MMIEQRERLCILCLIVWLIVAPGLLVGTVWALIELLGPA